MLMIQLLPEGYNQFNDLNKVTTGMPVKSVYKNEILYLEKGVEVSLSPEQVLIQSQCIFLLVCCYKT